MPPTATPATPPPLERWVPAPILSIIDTAPSNPALRGMIRNELHIVVPRTLPQESAVIRGHLTSSYETYAIAVREGRLQATTQAVVDDTPRRAQPTPVPPAAVRRNGEGHLLIEGIDIAGRETGRTAYTARINFRGAMYVPEEIVRQGEAAVVAYVDARRTELREDMHEFEYTAYTEQNVEVESSNMGTLSALVRALPPQA